MPPVLNFEVQHLSIQIMFAGATKKAFAKDLQDIKAAIESESGQASQPR